MIAALTKRIALYHLRREQARIREHLFVLYDQVASGEEGIRRYEAKQARIEEQIAHLEPPDVLIRRLGAGA